MEKEILEILKAMQQDIKGLKESQERLENKIDGVVEQTADLLEFRTKITDTVQQIKIDVEYQGDTISLIYLKTNIL